MFHGYPIFRPRGTGGKTQGPLPEADPLLCGLHRLGRLDKARLDLTAALEVPAQPRRTLSAVSEGQGRRPRLDGVLASTGGGVSAQSSDDPIAMLGQVEFEAGLLKAEQWAMHGDDAFEQADLLTAGRAYKQAVTQLEQLDCSGENPLLQAAVRRGASNRERVDAVLGRVEGQQESARRDQAGLLKLNLPNRLSTPTPTGAGADPAATRAAGTVDRAVESGWDSDGEAAAEWVQAELQRASELYSDYNAYEEAREAYLTVLEASQPKADGGGVQVVLGVEELAEVYNRLGLCVEKAGSWAEAIAYYSQGIRLTEALGEPRFALHYHRGRLLHQSLRDWAAATKDYTTCQRIQPDHPRLAKLVSQLAEDVREAAAKQAPGCVMSVTSDGGGLDDFREGPQHVLWLGGTAGGGAALGDLCGLWRAHGWLWPPAQQQDGGDEPEEWPQPIEVVEWLELWISADGEVTAAEAVADSGGDVLLLPLAGGKPRRPAELEAAKQRRRQALEAAKQRPGGAAGESVSRQRYRRTLPH